MIRTSPSFAIDPSTLPLPPAIKTLNYDAIVLERGKLLREKFAAAGVDYDVETLETDPGMILQQADAERELLDKAGINDAVRSVLPAFAKGSNLDHIVARANVERLEISPANPITGAAAVMESDPALLVRYLASFAAPAAGSEDGYYYRVASAWPQAWDISVRNGGAGRVLIYLLSPEGQAAPLDAILMVARTLQAKDARGLTDDVSVITATVRRYEASLVLRVPHGPDPELVRAQAEAAVRAFALERYAIGAEVPANALEAAAYVPNVLRVISSGLADIPARQGVAPWLASLTVKVEIVG